MLAVLLDSKLDWTKIWVVLVYSSGSVMSDFMGTWLMFFLVLLSRLELLRMEPLAFLSVSKPTMVEEYLCFVFYSVVFF